MSNPFTGEIKMFSFDFAPHGWAKCDGTELPIIQNRDLFLEIGTHYGGDGVKTFKLPDLRGRIPVYADGQGYKIGATGGEPAHTLVLGEVPPHHHVAQASTKVGSGSTPQDNVLAVAGLNAYAPPGQLQPLLAGTLGPEGASAPHENRQPYQVVNFCIALYGIEPPRN